MLLYYRLMTKWSGLGDSTELSRVGLSQVSTLEISQTSLGIHPKPKTSFCDYLLDHNQN
jgi:hypothetical protein